MATTVSNLAKTEQNHSSPDLPPPPRPRLIVRLKVRSPPPQPPTEAVLSPPPSLQVTESETSHQQRLILTKDFKATRLNLLPPLREAFLLQPQFVPAAPPSEVVASDTSHQHKRFPTNKLKTKNPTMFASPPTVALEDQDKRRKTLKRKQSTNSLTTFSRPNMLPDEDKTPKRKFNTTTTNNPRPAKKKKMMTVTSESYNSISMPQHMLEAISILQGTSVEFLFDNIDFISDARIDLTRLHLLKEDVKRVLTDQEISVLEGSSTNLSVMVIDPKLNCRSVTLKKWPFPDNGVESYVLINTWNNLVLANRMTPHLHKLQVWSFRVPGPSRKDQPSLCFAINIIQHKAA